MKIAQCALAIIATCVPTYAQTGITGTWKVDGVGTPFPWEVVLRTDGTRLTGMVSSCASPRQQIYEGHVNGDTIKFKCRSSSGDGFIAFTGTLKSDDIVFTWDLQVREGGARPPVENGMFGASAPPRFIAKRVPNDELEARGDTPGVEFAAAVNRLEQDVKVVGTLFLPQNISRVRALIVVIGYGRGESFYQNPQVRRLAERTDTGLLLAGFPTITTPTSYTPRDARQGGAEGLLVLLRLFAQESRHPEIADAPLLFWGHSAAGPFGTTFAAVHPHRTIAFVRYQSGDAGVELPLLSQIPALILAAGRDEPRVRVERAESLWKRGRSVAAPWTYAVQPNATHGDEGYLKSANELVIPWIAAVLRLRVPPDSPRLRVISDTTGWLGDNRTGEAASYSTFAASKLEASWLPDEASAQGWRLVLGPAQ